MQCRQFHSPQAAVMAAPVKSYGVLGMLMPMFFRTGAKSDDSMNGRTENCVNDWFAKCTGKVQSTGSLCLSAFGVSGTGPPAPTDYYNSDAACRSVFDYLYVRRNTTRFELDYAGVQDAESALKSMALTAIAGKAFSEQVRFDRLDYRGDTGDGLLGLYQRDYNPTGTYDLAVAANTEVAVWPRCRLKYTERPYRIRVNVGRIRMTVGMILESILTRVPPTFVRMDVEPHARARIEADLYYWADPDGGPSVLPPRVGMLPSVPNDIILYANESGQRIVPPLRVRWEGWLGHCGSVPAVRVSTSPTQLRFTCSQILQLLSDMAHGPDGATGMYIGGWPYRMDSRPTVPESIYRGGLTVGWDTSACHGQI
jgi:hypothetical protein